jgi:hypothetical protein
MRMCICRQTRMHIQTSVSMIRMWMCTYTCACMYMHRPHVRMHDTHRWHTCECAHTEQMRMQHACTFYAHVHVRMLCPCTCTCTCAFLGVKYTPFDSKTNRTAHIGDLKTAPGPLSAATSLRRSIESTDRSMLTRVCARIPPG